MLRKHAAVEEERRVYALSNKALEQQLAHTRSTLKVLDLRIPELYREREEEVARLAATHAQSLLSEKAR